MLALDLFRRSEAGSTSGSVTPTCSKTVEGGRNLIACLRRGAPPMRNAGGIVSHSPMRAASFTRDIVKGLVKTALTAMYEAYASEPWPPPSIVRVA